MHNYGDGKHYVKDRQNQISGTCSYPWTTMVILHDGKVITCCLDYNCVQVVEGIIKTPLKKYGIVSNIWKWEMI